MNGKIKIFLFSCLLLTLALFASSCSSDLSPYEDFNKDGYTVSVKYDANGGVFTTNTEVIVDTYNLSSFETGDDGKKAIKLFAPDDEIRGKQAYPASRVGYYLAGWYTERTLVSGEGEDAVYSYGGKWDFTADRLRLDPDGDYNAHNAVITLYAAWVPAFSYEFYTVDENGNETLIGTRTENPTAPSQLMLPTVNTETGKLGYSKDFPALNDMTYDKVYTDKELTNEIVSELITHSGVFDPDTAELENPVMKLYCTTLDGLWFEVDSAEKISKNSYLNAHYILKNDIDFEGKSWPATFTSKGFKGSIEGNGYTIKNITLTQNQNSVTYFGLFGQISDGAEIKNVTFDNITVNIKAGSRTQGCTFGILAGLISENSVIEGVTLSNSSFVFSSKTQPYISRPSYGIVCGLGAITGINYAENNTVSFDTDGNVEYVYSIDEEGRFTLEAKE